MKIFISHSEKDADLAAELVFLFEGKGLGSKDIFSYSTLGYGIKIGNDIYENIKQTLTNNDIFYIFIFSNEFLKSATCLMEMGAAWVTSENVTCLIASPNLTFGDIPPAIGTGRLSINLFEKSTTELSHQLIKLGTQIDSLFNKNRDNEVWIRRLELFIKRCNPILEERIHQNNLSKIVSEFYPDSSNLLRFSEFISKAKKNIFISGASLNCLCLIFTELQKKIAEGVELHLISLDKDSPEVFSSYASFYQCSSGEQIVNELQSNQYLKRLIQLGAKYKVSKIITPIALSAIDYTTDHGCIIVRQNLMGTPTANCPHFLIPFTDKIWYPKYQEQIKLLQESSI
jgi:hypothetical protein